MKAKIQNKENSWTFKYCQGGWKLSCITENELKGVDEKCELMNYNAGKKREKRDIYYYCYYY